MPLLGAIVGLAAVVGLAGWTAVRVKAANQARSGLEQKRAEDAKRAAIMAAAPQRARWVVGKPELWQPIVEFEGTVAAARSAELGFKTGGRIGSLRVKLGDVVKAGSVIATLDANEAAAQLKAANAQAAAATARLALASDSERRTQQMVQTGSVAEARGVESVQERALAQAQLDAARAQIGVVQVSLANHALIAPFTGTISKAPDGVGAVVASGGSLFSLVDLSTLKLKGTVSEQDANLLEPGTAIEVTGERGVVKGKITVVVGVVDSATRRVPVEAALDNGGKAALRAGAFVRARALGGESLPVLRLPHEVLRPGSQDELFVEQGGVLESRRVVFAVAPDGAFLVRRGVADGEHVIVGPKAEAKTGDKVAAEPAGATP
jgi:RND family efflux transporter MFP subunit